MNSKKITENYKKMGGLVALVMGLVLLGFGIYGSYRMSDARKNIDSSANFVPGKSARGFFQGTLHGEVDKYKTPVALCYIGGVVFLVGGLFLVRYSSEKQ